MAALQQQATRDGSRPLSPHLTIYKPIPTMVMSIMHRITGVGLYLGTILVVWWLYAVAFGAGYYDFVSALLGGFFGRLVMFAFTWALMHHLAGGIRHFFWDIGMGFEKRTATMTAWLTLAFSITATIMIWSIGYGVR